MKKICFLLSLLLTAVSSTFAAPKTPQVVIPDNYQGTSFTAQWNANGSSQYLFSLYTLGTDMVSVTEDFSKVNQSNGKLDTTNPNLPADWTVDLAENGTTEVVYYNDKNHLLLDATGDKIVTPLLVGGNLSKYVLNANLVHAEGVTEDNSSVFNIKVYDKEGDLLTQGDIYAIYFARRQDFVLSEAFGYTPLNIGKIEITIKKDDTHNVGDISVNSISYEYKAPVYVLTDQPTTEDHYDATGLVAEAVYYYYVKAKEGNEVSPMSGIMRVDGFLSVKVLPASNVGVDAFTANWEYLPKAKGYYLQPYRYDVAAEAGVFSALNEKFSKSLDGTIESPITSVTNPNDLTDCPGWSGRNLIAAAGMLGANSGRFPMNMSYVHSPSMNLSRNGGVYTVRLKAHGTPGDILSIYHVGYMENNQLVMHKATFDANGNIDETWEMKDGDSETILSFEENKMKPFLLDEVEVTQKVNKGDISTVTLPEIKIENPQTTSYDFSNLVAGTRYGYTVTGWRLDGFGGEEKSETSQIEYADLQEPSGITDAAANGEPQVSAVGNIVNVTLAQNAPIYVFSVEGRTRQVVNGKVGVNSIILESGKVYIVKVGGRAYKVAAL